MRIRPGGIKNRLRVRRAQALCLGEAGMSDAIDRVPALEREIEALRDRLAKAQAELQMLTGADGEPPPAARKNRFGPGDFSNSSELFRLFVEHMRNGAVMLSENGTVCYCNQEFAHILGLPTARILGRNFNDFIAGESSALVQRLIASDASSFESGLRAQSGATVPVQISPAPPLMIDGQHIRCLVVTDLTRHELKLRHEAVVQASKDAIYALSPSLQIETWNRGAESIFGYAPAEIIGKSERELCPPSELAALDDLVQQVQERGAAVTVDAVRWRKDRSKIRVILSLTPIREIGGRTIGYAVVAHDITERKRTERELREAMARTSLALAAGRMGTFELDFATERCTWSDQVYAIHGLDRATFEPTLARVRELIHPNDREVFGACLDRALQEGSFEVELRVRHRDGRYIWVHGRGLVRFDGDDKPQALFGVVADITERKEAERNQQLLIAELNHRVRNTLATVQAIASQTLRRARSPAEFVPSFSGRIQALSRAHTLLTRTAWQGAEIDSLIREQLLLGSTDRITCEGPPVSLEPQTALQLALVLHELGTNARKYGSLSVPRGYVMVNWTVEQTENGDTLHLTWMERDGPPVTPPESTGFGTLLIERSLQQGQGGHTQILFNPDGVICKIRLPITHSHPPSSAQERAFTATSRLSEE